MKRENTNPFAKSQANFNKNIFLLKKQQLAKEAEKDANLSYESKINESFKMGTSQEMIKINEE